MIENVNPRPIPNAKCYRLTSAEEAKLAPIKDRWKLASELATKAAQAYNLAQAEFATAINALLSANGMDGDWILNEEDGTLHAAAVARSIEDKVTAQFQQMMGRHD